LAAESTAKSFAPCFCFTVPGEVVGQARPRFSTFGGHVRAYDTAKSRSRKADIQVFALEAAHKEGWDCETAAPLRVLVLADFGVPKSKSKKWTADAIAGKVRPTKKPDIDNIAKLVLDACNGVVFRDDCQIVDIYVRKKYSVNPQTEVYIFRLDIWKSPDADDRGQHK